MQKYLIKTGFLQLLEDKRDKQRSAIISKSAKKRKKLCFAKSNTQSSPLTVFFSCVDINQVSAPQVSALFKHQVLLNLHRNVLWHEVSSLYASDRDAVFGPALDQNDLYEDKILYQKPESCVLPQWFWSICYKQSVVRSVISDFFLINNEKLNLFKLFTTKWVSSNCRIWEFSTFSLDAFSTKWISQLLEFSETHLCLKRNKSLHGCFCF